VYACMCTLQGKLFFHLTLGSVFCNCVFYGYRICFMQWWTNDEVFMMQGRGACERRACYSVFRWKRYVGSSCPTLHTMPRLTQWHHQLRLQVCNLIDQLRGSIIRVPITTTRWRFGVAVTALGASTNSICRPVTTEMSDRLRTGKPPQ